MRYEETMSALTELAQEGKVRVVGCSNETCWGLMKSVQVSREHGLVRHDTVQNNFSLINRRCESELAQVCRQEGISLLPYSPLGGGVLTGKYATGDLPVGARFSEYLVNGNERQKKMAKRFSQFDQLADNLAAADLVLDQETMQQIDDLHVDIPLSMTEDGLRYL